MLSVSLAATLALASPSLCSAKKVVYDPDEIDYEEAGWTGPVTKEFPSIMPWSATDGNEVPTTDHLPNDDFMLSDFPSGSPIAPPSDFPSLVPTLIPSPLDDVILPSDYPSLVPTSDLASDVPSLGLSDTPSDLPSLAPSPLDAPVGQDFWMGFVPTVTPERVSVEPRSEPTGRPTSQGITGAPTSLISDIPSAFPSDVPSTASSTVSDYPSLVPSDLPSDVPSDVPSGVPSDLPSIGVSTAPSADSTVGLNFWIGGDVPGGDEALAAPTGQPASGRDESDAPSDVPSSLMSDVPSLQPSDLPSLQPIAVAASSSVPSSAVLADAPVGPDFWIGNPGGGDEELAPPTGPPVGDRAESDVPSSIPFASLSDAPSDIPSAGPNAALAMGVEEDPAVTVVELPQVEGGKVGPQGKVHKQKVLNHVSIPMMVDDCS